jgi:Lysine methyltransferase/Ankyrin repeats (3 copies)
MPDVVLPSYISLQYPAVLQYKMSKKGSSHSRLLQVLLRRKDEPFLANTADAPSPLEVDDLIALMNDIRALNMEERGMELRDAARYNDYLMVHSLLYVTAVLNSDDSVAKPIPCLDEAIDCFSKNPIVTARAARAVLQLLNSVDSTTGNMALHMAAANNHFRIVQLLLHIEQASLEDIESHSTEDTIQEEKPTTRLVQCANQSGGNTPLHYAITNRALEAVQSLLSECEPTTDGAQPMNVSDALTRRYTNPCVDVLQKNSAGRSSLTEAFALSYASDAGPDADQRNHAILTLVLEHHSANEDRLLDVTSSSIDDTKADSTIYADGNHLKSIQSPRYHTHHFRFVGSKNVEAEGIDLCVREMAMASSDSMSSNNDQIAILGGSVPMKDTTGYGIWSVSIIMAQWMTDVFHWNRNSYHNDLVAKRIEMPGTGNNGCWNNVRTIVELGAGCGVPGLAIAKSISLANAGTTNRDHDITTKVYLTDLNPKTILNLQHNIELNKLNHIASAVTMDWDDLDDKSKVWPWTRTDTMEDTVCCIDILIGSDLVYQRESVPALIQTIMRLRPQHFYYGAGKNRDGHDMFIDALSNSQPFNLISSRTAPMAFRCSNPLLSKDDDECFIHFQDLLLPHNSDSFDVDDAFTLYEFAQRAPC